MGPKRLLAAVLDGFSTLSVSTASASLEASTSGCAQIPAYALRAASSLRSNACSCSIASNAAAPSMSTRDHHQPHPRQALLASISHSSLYSTLSPCQGLVSQQIGALLRHGLPGPLSQVHARAYRSNKRSMKPLNSTASWLAVEPLLKEQERQRQEADGSLLPGAPRKAQRESPLLDTVLPPIPEVPKPPLVRRVGRITAPYQLELEQIFGVVEIGGTQFKVTTDDVLFVNQLPDVDINDVLALERVLLLGSRSQTIIGRPYVPGALVLVAVEEHFRDGKVHVFKKKRKKRYRRYQAPRPAMTTLRVLKVAGIHPAQGDLVAQLPQQVELIDANVADLLPSLSDVEVPALAEATASSS